ncbi:ParB/RepB/Spo0J family partition protein [Entomobacter blattae]|uniref:Chromosome-partitioning protein ParB n=1 Tax=Entomobacter blattae TaxID=2762277 RepID=A0A7H1NPN1_9PROT|nr:ParB/RepB/Spo0J family partition protein [Entomobacter blattae]QNT77741.1 Chromosome-partitioning protein ParB [Entomobacter blattae]
MEAKKRNTRSQLGRGLAALLGEPPVMEREKGPKAESSIAIPVEKLEPGPFQPRQIMHPQALEELAASIRARGVLQPLLVRPHPKEEEVYQIIAGERRWRAAQMAGLHEVPVHVRHLSNSDAMVAALVENLQRADLNSMEEAEGLHRLIQDFDLTQEEVAQAVGKSRSHIANTLRLLNLPSAVIEWVRRGDLSAGHARALLGVADPVQEARMVIDKGLSVRQVEQWVASQNRKKPSSQQKKEHKENTKDVDILALEKDLYRKLGLDVKIAFDGKGGHIKINYKTLDQLDSVLALLNAGLEA